MTDGLSGFARRQQVRREELVRMANQIAHFFAPYPEADAIDGVRDHIEKFWDPAMRRALIAIAAQESQDAHVQSGAEQAALHPLVVQSVARLRPPSTT